MARKGLFALAGTLLSALMVFWLKRAAAELEAGEKNDPAGWRGSEDY